MKIHKLTDPRIRYFFLGKFLLTCALFLTGCNQKQKYNVLIVTFDTTRADHISTYRNDKSYTPVLDKLAKDGVVYEKCLAPIPITLPSHSTIMTGKVPFTHGARDNGLFNLSEDNLTLAEIFKNNGYNTAAAIGSFPLTSKFGLNQGFDYYNEYITQKYEDVFGDRTVAKDALYFDERKAAQVNDGIMPWLKDKGKSPFFAWIHYFDPHRPHEPPSPYNQLFSHDLYKGEIAYSDESLGTIIEQLKELGVYDNTLIVFTSDHGEGNGEHNESTHSMLIYNSTLHVPLIIKYPNQQYANTRIKKWVASVDIFPTVLSVLGHEIPDNIQGSVLPIINDNEPSHEIYSETLSPRFSRGWGEQRGLVKNDYKYIYGPLKELYNLKKDPHEVNNIIAEKPDLAKSMKASLQDYLDEHYVESDINSSTSVDADTLNTLRGLGYIQSSGEAVSVFEEKLDDSGEAPQLLVSNITAYSTTKQLIFNKDYVEALRYLDNLLISDPENLAYKELKIRIFVATGNIIGLKELLESLPNDSFGVITAGKRLEFLAHIYLTERNLTKAKELFIESDVLEPNTEVQNQIAKIFSIEKKPIEQQNYLLKILQSNPNQVKTVMDLAISYSITGDLIKAEDTFIHALKINPLSSSSFYNYGVFLISVDDFDSAINQFIRAIELQPNYEAAHYAKIESLVKLNKPDEAMKAAENLYKLSPNGNYSNLAKNLLNK